ncbi:MAG: hypothetical protein QOC59_916 [Microbacteriaceae bacterium]|nr:hypothetical protein [Microbacteriaceae bacterium]
MPNYLLAIRVDESAAAQAAGSEVSSPFQEFMQRRAGVLRGGAALAPASTARAVRPDGSGGVTVTDAPFAEAKEVLGGYFVIEAADDDEALAIAKEVPAPFGWVEVRPIRVMS